MLTPTEWFTLIGLLVLIQTTVIGATVWIVRAAPKAVREHERSCANYEPNTALQMKVVQREIV